MKSQGDRAKCPTTIKEDQGVGDVIEGGVFTAARIDSIIPTFNNEERELELLVDSLARAGVKHITVSMLKLVRGSMSVLKWAALELYRRLDPLYREGTWIHGYRYLSRGT